MRTLILLVVMVSGCTTTPSTTEFSERVRPVTTHVYVGPVPEGDLELTELNQRGFRSILSVDALPTPSGSFEFSRVHLPLGYGAMDLEMKASLAKAIQSLEPPIYVHCHRGLHRAPTAAVVGLIGLGRLTVAEGLDVLRRIGTSREYPGLWLAVESMGPLTPAAIDALAIEPLPRVATPTPTAETMAAIDRLFERLSTVAEAGMLGEHFRALAAVEDVPALRRGFLGGVKHASTLEQALRSGQSIAIELAYANLEASCTACHSVHRNRVVHSSDD